MVKLTVAVAYLRTILVCFVSLVLLAMTGCGPVTSSQSPTFTRENPSPTPLSQQATATLELSPTPVFTPIPDSPALPLSQPGPYFISKRRFSFQDHSRGNRQVSITVWYPALKPTGAHGSSQLLGPDQATDIEGAPYPLLISSTEMANTLARYVVSHGFTWVSVNGIHSYGKMHEQMYTQPLDILFALDQVASVPLQDLAGMFDAEHAGALGYSFDGYNTLAMSGARIDPEFYLSQCANPNNMLDVLQTELCAYSCEPAHDWEAFTTLIGESITSSEDGLWQPMTDQRIRAVMPMAGEGWWLFGERGLAAIDRPVLILVATNDELYPQNALIFEHIGTPDKAMISFMNLDHMMVFKKDQVTRMAHFTVAFFGYHLQGHDDYARFFSEEFVAQFDNLAWGVVDP